MSQVPVRTDAQISNCTYDGTIIEQSQTSISEATVETYHGFWSVQAEKLVLSSLREHIFASTKVQCFHSDRTSCTVVSRLDGVLWH